MILSFSGFTLSSMGKRIITKTTVTIGFAVAVIAFIAGSVFAYRLLNALPVQKPLQKATTLTVSPAFQTPEHVWYNGRHGVNALDLLKEKVPIEQDASGLITMINNRKAGNHEYWAFYVNGTLSSVGPQQYITKDGDKLEWKIEKY